MTDISVNQLYENYLKAESIYLKKPNCDNWDIKEKAFEAYNEKLRELYLIAKPKTID